MFKRLHIYFFWIFTEPRIPNQDIDQKDTKKQKKYQMFWKGIPLIKVK